MPYKDPEKQKLAQHEWYLENKGLTLERSKESRAKYKSFVYGKINEIKKNPCLDCRQCFDPVCMDFDHIRDDKFRGISHMVHTRCKWERIFEEIQKCELVCSNCHRIRTRNRRPNNHY